MSRRSQSFSQAMVWSLVLSSMISTPVLSAQTDISSSPITSTNAAQVKPNVMMLMDTSYSMGWTHMPDQIETEPGYDIFSIGYKAAQCNVLYYNPATAYDLPKRADGTFFPTPSFGSARVNAFDITNLATVDLAVAFKAYDTDTLRYNDPVYRVDTAQPAYYYVKTGGTVPITTYNSSPCLDLDVNATAPSSDGGTWTRVVVSGAERTNFAVWYSYYRTRILLMKTAASVAFTPLTDSVRVGFITVMPKNSASDPAINPDKYLPIADFTTTQRGLWYDKLFEQRPQGSSPTREGLARVGRHYAGAQDGINQGMTGDPVQFSCQQNFTIMTTDGYWNSLGHSSNLTGSFIGGGVDIAGTALVGQRDGNLDALTTNSFVLPEVDPNFNGTPRPIWDGMFDGIRTIRTRINRNEYTPCGTYFTMTTSELTRSTSQLLKTTSQTTQSSFQNLQSTVQRRASTTQTLRGTSQTTRSTFQSLESTNQNLRSTAQRLSSTAQNTQSTIRNLESTNQNLRSTTQNLANSQQLVETRTRVEQVVWTPRQSTTQNLQSTTQRRQSTTQQNQGTAQRLQSTAQNTYTQTITTRATAQTRRDAVQTLQRTEQNLATTAQTLQRTEQITASTSQTTASTLQLTASTSQLQITTSQVRRSTSQEFTCDGAGENCVPNQAGQCVSGGGVTCVPQITGPTLVDVCNAETPGSGNSWRTVTCATTTNPPVPAGACMAASANSGNAFTTTTCFTAVTVPTPVATCIGASANSGNAYTETVCTPLATGPTFVPSCAVAGANSGNNFTATTCSTATTGPVGVDTCVAQLPDVGNDYLARTCGTNNTINTAVASCSPLPARNAGNNWVTTICTPNNASNQPVLSCTNSGPTAGNFYTTTSCSTNNSVDTPVATCAASAATGGNSYTATICTANNTSVPSGSCVPQTATTPSWTEVTCPTVNGSAYAVPLTCAAQTGDAGNLWTTVTCSDLVIGPTVYGLPSCFASYDVGFYRLVCTPNVTTNVPVAACTASGPNAGNSYTTITCADNNSALTPVQICAPVTPVGPDFIATICPIVATTNVGVPACTASVADAGNSWTDTTCNDNNTVNVPVASCSASAPNAGNFYTDTTCSSNNTTNVAVNSCLASGPNSGNGYTTTTCPPETLVSGPTVVGSCTPVPATDPLHERTDCNTVIVAVGVQTCVPDPPSAGNGFVGTTCSTQTASTPVLNCTAQSPNAGNNWVEIICGTNDQLNVPVLSCTPSGPDAGNAWTTTTCPPPITTGPTPVASCTAEAATSLNLWTSRACPPPITTGPTGVASCTAIPADVGNTWTATTCGTNNFVNVPVQTCTDEVAGSGNSWTATTCSNNNTTNEPVATCSAQTATGPDWITVTCPPPVATTNVPVPVCVPEPFPTAANSFTTTTCAQNDVLYTPSGTCSPISPVLGNGYTTTTCPTLVQPPVGSDACTAQTGDGTNSWLTVTCTPNNTLNVGVASCVDSGANAGNGWTATVCNDNNTSNVGVATCSAGPGTNLNDWVTTSCSTNNTSNVPVASCTPVAGDSGNGWLTTTCPVLVVGPIGASSCAASGPNSGNLHTTTTCPGTVATGPTAVASCIPALADSTNSWTATTCAGTTSTPTVVTTCNPSTPNAGNGYTTITCVPISGNQLNVTTATRTQVFAVSNGVQAAIGTDVTTTVGPAPSGVCHAPGTEPPLPPNGFDTWTAADASAYPTCSGWPCSVDVGTNNPRSENSLADVAQYYYVTDLRTPSNEPRGIDYHRNDVPGVGGSGGEDDKALWQHMTTMGVALGVSGTLQYRGDYQTAAVGDFARIRAGTLNWPLWPDPALDYVGNPSLYENPRAIDDFWHASVNGRGTFFSASNPASVIAGLAGALARIEGLLASSTGAGTSNLEPVAGDNFAYLASYTTQDWTGDVQAREVDLSNGNILPTVIWSAKTRMNSTVGNACDNRKIFLFRNGATNNLTNFSWNSQACDAGFNPTGAADTGLDSAEQAYFGASNVALLSQHPSMTDGSGVTPNQRADAAGANLVNFLRGQKGLEDYTPGVANKLYRQRMGRLGDVVNGQPVYVRAPFGSYSSNNYAAFKAANLGRTPMLYVAANDGMLHAFFAGTDITDPDGGKEAWAVIPTSVLPNLFKLADHNYGNIHQYYVDGTPSVSDVFDGSQWKTMLVGGLNDGGRGYYALDVTDPLVPKGLWEFKWSDTCYDSGNAGTFGADCHLGKTFGKPLITKLSDGRWVVMVSSGYNNVNTTPKTGDGLGYLYVLNAQDGKILYKIPTTAGDPTTPSGLAQINNFVEKAEIDNTTVRVYGGDVLGNIWRFDVNDNTAPTGGREATLIGTATNAAGIGQPITVRPELTQIGGKPMIFVATGKLLGATDTTDTQTQSIYGIIDPVVGTTAFPPLLRSALAPLRMTQVGVFPSATRTVACTGSAAQCGSADGWYIDLPDLGERVNVEMKLRGQTLIVGSNVPRIGPCTPGGYSWLNYFDFRSGLAVQSAPGNAVSVAAVNSLIVGLTVIKIGNGANPYRAILTTNRAGVVTRGLPTFTSIGNPKRVSWREVLQ